VPSRLPEPDNSAIVDAARLSRSFSEIYELLDRTAPGSGAFCTGHQVGFNRSDGANPYLWIKDISPTEVVVGCWGCQGLWQAPYTIAADDTVTFGKATRVAERFVPVEGEELTDDLAPAEGEIEFLDAAGPGHGPRMRILSTKANTVINGRVYPLTVLRTAVAELRQKVRTATVWAEAPHPKPIRKDGKVIGFESNHDRRTSRITNVEINDRGEVWTEHEFLATPLALEVHGSFQSRTGKYGISQRAIGKTAERRLSGRDMRVADTLQLHAYDFVPNPALTATVSAFEVLLDAELQERSDSEVDDDDPDETTDRSLGPAPEAQRPADAASQEEPKAMPQTQAPSQGAASASAAPPPATVAPLAATSPQALVQTSAAAPVLPSPEDLATLAQARAIIEADTRRRQAEAARSEVAAFATSSEVGEAVAGFPEAARNLILDRVGKAANRSEAEATLAAEIDLVSRISSVAKLAAIGYGQPAAGQGATTSTAQQTVDVSGVEVSGNPKPYLEVARRFGEAYDRHARRVANFVPDPGLRVANQDLITQLLAKAETSHGQALLDSAEALLDSSHGGWEAFTDSASDSTANLWNQPTISTVLFIQQFQDLVFGQWVDGMGPDNFERRNFNGKIGSVLRVPVEIYQAPPNSLSLPGYDNGLLVGEDAGIPEASVETVWLEFAPQWRRVAASLTKDAAQALKNGPFNYDALVRIVYHMTEDKKRRLDSALAEEMLAIADEYGAVAVADEAVAAGNLVANTGANKLYGNSVTYYAKLVGSGTAGAPRMDPLVRARRTVTLPANGAPIRSTLHPTLVTAPANQVQGYLDANSQIVSDPANPGATFAVDFNNGRICFNAASGVDGNNLPTVSYTYVTNYDTFSPAIPNGVENNLYYNRLLEQIDNTAALMGSFPRFKAPNLCIGSLKAMTRVINAQLFYKLASPEGARLSPTSQNMIAERNCIMFGRHNAPWSAGDGRLLLTQRGSTKLGVDTPFEIEGPFPTYDSSNRIRDTKVIKGSENSIICTPQVTDQAGTVLNPVSRSIYFR
jgi:hypothetical protein